MNCFQLCSQLFFVSLNCVAMFPMKFLPYKDLPQCTTTIIIIIIIINIIITIINNNTTTEEILFSLTGPLFQLLQIRLQYIHTAMSTSPGIRVQVIVNTFAHIPTATRPIRVNIIVLLIYTGHSKDMMQF